MQLRPWRIDPFSSRRERPGPPRVHFVLVGVGGTGGYLAEHIAHLMLHYGLETSRLTLIDMDVVEQHNILRQPFGPADVGRPKAAVIRDRLRPFPIELACQVTAYDAEAMYPLLFERSDGWDACLLIGAVDNAAARAELARTLEIGGNRSWWNGPAPVWYLDCGNSDDDGQILLGNAARPEQLTQAFRREGDDGVCQALPAPALQAPELLQAPAKPVVVPGMDCALAQVAGNQGPRINAAMAATAKATLSFLLEGRCSWRRVTLNLVDGVLRYTPATPGDVAALVGLPVSAVLRHKPEPRRRGERGRVRPRAA